jgi:amidase
MAHASDGGGSIRIPASCCGLFGLKPTRARNPLGPSYGDVFNGLVVEHALTRTVRDSAALLDATSGPDVGDPYAAPAPERPYREEVGRDPGRLRIGFIRRSASGSPVAPECVAAVDDAARLLAGLGHDVEEAMPDLDAVGFTQAFIAMWAGCNGWAVDALAAATGRKPSPDNLEPLTWAMYQMAQGTTAVAHLNALTTLQRISRQVSAYFVERDVLLTPTLGELPAVLGSFDAQPGNPMAGLFRSALYTPFTPIANVTGQPAMSLPTFWAGRLPVGVQLVGRFGAEGTLFRLAAQVEAARPWAERWP